MDEINDKGNVNTPITDLLMSTLKRGGCMSELDDRGCVGINYQDIQLLIQPNEELRSITVYDISWYSVSIYDAEAVIQMKAEVNRVNSFGDAKLVYQENDDDCIYVTTVFTFPFSEEIEDIESYFADGLASVISYRQAFIKEEEEQKITQ